MHVRSARSGPPAAPCVVASFLAIFLLTGACAVKPKPASAPPSSRDVIVLLPDFQGKTGAIIVSGKGGSRVLSEPGQTVTVEAGGPPGEPYVMARKEVLAEVGAALSTLPPPPVTFILYFRNDTSELTAESREEVRRVVRAIRDRGAVDISVVGHTDTVGSKSYNHRLSLRRSRAVAALLANEGVDRSLVELACHGKENPLVPTGDQVHEPRNRRVEVTVR